MKNVLIHIFIFGGNIFFFRNKHTSINIRMDGPSNTYMLGVWGGWSYYPILAYGGATAVVA